MKNPKISIIVLCFNNKPFIKECIDTLLAQTQPNIKIHFVDNNSSDGSADEFKRLFPDLKITEFNENIGYTGANNKIMAEEFKNGADFCFLINADTKSDSKMLTGLLKVYDKYTQDRRKVGLLQPAIYLYDKPDTINTIGNTIHYLGFGYCKNYMDDRSIVTRNMEITSVSGAAMLISKEFYNDVGGFDDNYFLYNEDMQLSWAGLLKGYSHYMVADAEVYHKYEFSRWPEKIYYSEKNRLMSVLMNYSLWTLIILSPMLILNEIVAILYAAVSFQGYFSYKVKSSLYLLKNCKKILHKRWKIQNSRTVSDREIIHKFSGKLEAEIQKNILLRVILNPIYDLYFRIVKLLVV